MPSLVLLLATGPQLSSAGTIFQLLKNTHRIFIIAPSRDWLIYLIAALFQPTLSESCVLGATVLYTQTKMKGFHNSLRGSSQKWLSFSLALPFRLSSVSFRMLNQPKFSLAYFQVLGSQAYAVPCGQTWGPGFRSVVVRWKAGMRRHFCNRTREGKDRRSPREAMSSRFNERTRSQGEKEIEIEVGIGR